MLKQHVAASPHGNLPNRCLRRLLLALPLSWAFLSASPAYALLLTWDVDNQLSGNWYDQNWIGAGATGVPTADDDVVLPGGSQVTLDQNALARSLRIESGPETYLDVLGGSLLTGDITIDTHDASSSRPLFVAAGASVIGKDLRYYVGGYGIQVDGLLLVASAGDFADNTRFIINGQFIVQGDWYNNFDVFIENFGSILVGGDVYFGPTDMIYNYGTLDIGGRLRIGGTGVFLSTGSLSVGDGFLNEQPVFDLTLSGVFNGNAYLWLDGPARLVDARGVGNIYINGELVRPIEVSEPGGGPLLFSGFIAWLAFCAFRRNWTLLSGYGLRYRFARATA